jgi:glycosyltransferase involved in cell wall biosynthesis
MSAALHVIASNDRRGAEVFATDLVGALHRRGRRDRVVALATARHGPGLGHPVLGGPSGRHALARAATTLRAVRRLRQLARGGTGAPDQVRAAARSGGTADPAHRLGPPEAEPQATVPPALVAHGSAAVPAAALATLGLPQPGAGRPGPARRGFVYRNIGDPAHWTAGAARAARVRAYLRRAERVVALWPGAAEVLHSRLGVPAERIRVIPTGVPAERFPPADAAARTAARARLGAPWPPPGVPTAVACGALSPEKRPDAAVRAVARLDGVHLVLVGDGPERARLEALAAAVAPGRVHFAGTLPDPAPALAAADLLVLPSATEGIAAVCIEAAFTQRAVVATAVGGTPEVVADGETGTLVPDRAGRPDTELIDDLAEAIAATLPVADRLGAAARPRALARYDLEVVADAWADLLAELDG